MGDIRDGDNDGSVSGWLREDSWEAFNRDCSSTDTGWSCLFRESKAIARVDCASAGAVGGGGGTSALRLVKKFDISICFP